MGIRQEALLQMISGFPLHQLCGNWIENDNQDRTYRLGQTRLETRMMGLLGVGKSK